ncbi:hypothetical protein [Phocaeicola faecium]|uniref:Uncharacterized protein n=1 Tax=Phocaeicola faecium TaxID=2762213 RepID=A0ABR8VD86_9BACT|nr:hypothetical protein [Phocaeicola faecium]MBD8002719.1 hypothetical protein [Phocaeicola faecium]
MNTGIASFVAGYRKADDLFSIDEPAVKLVVTLAGSSMGKWSYLILRFGISGWVSVSTKSSTISINIESTARIDFAKEIICQKARYIFIQITG